ncbi:VOC family protein [Jidongwangia harbinensis]|uniref:VOC family protein n=1 Tax=Jidongwangia harbinensis TaxID=2878561 RepID=UPI002104CA1D
MAYEFQVTQDSADPHTLADWWAETLDWVVEPSDEAFIRRMIAEGYASDGDTKVHRGTLVWREGAAIRHPDGLKRAPRLLFQLVPEKKAGKNRMHLDVRIGVDGDVEAAVGKLTARGATRLHDGRQGPHTWVTLADPEGNEFCVSRSAPEDDD